MKRYAATDENFLNPERGFYDRVDIDGDMGHVRTRWRTLAYCPVRLDDYRERELDDVLFARLDAGWERARAAGIKLILRFVYNDGPWPVPDADAPCGWILRHLEQLRAPLARGEDVIAVLQGGFIGAWGEWHDSKYGLDNPVDRGKILRGLLAALPRSRMVQLRTPGFKKETFGRPIDGAEAFSREDRARVGHHDDCFLASREVACTIYEPVEEWRAYVVSEGLWVPVGGETCAPNPPVSDAAAAMAEMAAWRFVFLNGLYHGDVLAGWEREGKLVEIGRTLGYRFRVAWSRVADGVVEAGIVNEGWGCLWNERPVYVVVAGGARVLVETDARRWRPGEEVYLRARVPRGAGRVGLWLPDASPKLAERSEFAVRLDGTEWDVATGMNWL